MTDAQQLAGEEILEFAEQMEASSNKLGTRIIAHFMHEALPLGSDATRELVGDLVVTTMTAVGKEFSATPRTGVEIEDYAEAMVDMLRAYLTSIIRHHEATQKKGSPRLIEARPAKLDGTLSIFAKR